MSRKHQVTLILTIQALLVLSVTVAVGSKLLPVGVPGEWEWNRLADWATLSWDGLTIAGLAVAIYAGFAALGLRLLAASRSRLFEGACVAGLLFASLCIQVIVPMGAPAGYDLTKWASVNYLPGSAGYFQIARQQAAGDPWKFLADYPDWIRSQDVFHIGTHPPGLIAAQCLLLRTMDQNPRLTGALLDHMPPSVDAGFRVFVDPDPKPLSRAERATLYATALLTLLACAGTVVPLYLLARAALPASAAWAAAVLWPLAPCANLFQPVADTAYPLLSTSALALAAWAARSPQKPGRRGPISALLAAASGIVMAFGMSFSLAFLPVGLIVLFTLIGDTAAFWRSRAILLLATGAGFLTLLSVGWAVTAANPFVIASWNLRHHAQFYVEYPRSYLLWVWVNPLETAIALGLPAVSWCVAAFLAPRTVPVPAWSTLLVLVVINLTGRNMGEVARLWMLFMPPLLVAAGAGMSRVGARPSALGATIALIGAQTLALQAMIQVVYPV
jgi:methylthioxylose transferase